MGAATFKSHSAVTTPTCPTLIGDRVKQLQSKYPDFQITIKWYESPSSIGESYLRMAWTATKEAKGYGSASSLNDNPSAMLIESVMDYLTRNAWDMLMQ